MDKPKDRRSPFNSRGELRVALPGRSASKGRMKVLPPKASSNQEIQKALDAMQEDYRVRGQWWDRFFADDPAKKKEKRRHVRRRLESLQRVRIHIARLEGKLGMQTHPESRR